MIEKATDVPAASYRVIGTVRDRSGTPIAKCRIELFDRELFRKDLRLAKGRTGDDGTFDIPYPAKKIAGRGKKQPDLIVKVFGAAGDVLATSELIPQTDSDCVVHLCVAGPTTGPTEFEQVLQAVLPRLKGRQLAGLVGEQVDYLSQVTGVAKGKVERLVASARCARDFAAGGNELPESVFYAWASQGLPADASQLVLQRRQRLKVALDRAHEGNITPACAHYAVDSALRRARVAREMQPAPAGEPLSVADLFGSQSMAIGGDAQRSSPVLSGDKRDILAKLRVDAETTSVPDAELLVVNGFTPLEIALITRMTSLAELTGHDLALVRILHGVAGIDSGRTSGSLAYLARLQPPQWRAVVSETADAGVPETARARRAAELEQKIEAAFRTAVIAARIGQHQMAVPADSRRDLIAFFADNPEFQFGKVRVTSHLDRDARLHRVANRGVLERQLLKLERTIKLTDNHRQQSALLAAGLDSAHKIARKGRREVLRQLALVPGVGADAAAAVVSRAEHIAAVASTLLMAYRDPGIALPVMDRAGFAARTALAPAESVLNQIPDLATLFGTLDTCACDPCQSVLSPSAYFVDLLKFLEDRKAVFSVEHPPVDPLPYALSGSGPIPLLVDGRCTLDSPASYEVAITGAGTATAPVDGGGGFRVSLPLGVGTHELTFELRHKGASDNAVRSRIRRTVRVEAVSASLVVVEPASGNAYPMNEQMSTVAVAIHGYYALSPASPFEVLIDAGIGSVPELAQIDEARRAFSAMLSVVAGRSEMTVTLRATENASGTVLATTKVVVFAISGTWSLSMVRPWVDLPVLPRVDPNSASATHAAIDGNFVIDLLDPTMLDGAEVAISVDGSVAVIADFVEDGQYATVVDLPPGDHTVKATLRARWREQELVVLSWLEREVSVFDDSAAVSIVHPSAPISVEADWSTFDLQVDGHYVIATRLTTFDIVLVVDGEVLSTCQLDTGGAGTFSGQATVTRASHDVAVRLRLPPGGATLASASRAVSVASPIARNVAATAESLRPEVAVASTLELERTATPIAPDSALAVLLDRRPDLAEIELSCENSDTPIPYLDLVLEILEAAAGEQFPQQIALSADAASAAVRALDAGDVTAALRAAIKTISPPLSARSTATVIEPGAQWTVKDGARRLGLKWLDSALLFAWYAPQTPVRGDADDPQPAHFNASAYEALKTASYPLALPFDLWTEDARAQLSHLGVPRHALMQVFYCGAGWQQPELGSPGIRRWRSAAERFGLSEFDVKLIDGSQRGAVDRHGGDHGPWNFWGMLSPALSGSNSIPDPVDTGRRIRSGSWPDVLSGRLDVLLQQSGLRYDELVQLLDMRFVNARPNGDRILVIQLGTTVLDAQHQTVSCDLSAARLVGAGATKPGDAEGVLERIHRFVRLWRRLGWPMVDVDRALMLLQSAEDPTTPYLVHGSVVDPSGQPLAGLVLTAIDQDVVREDTLGTGTTDVNGNYRIAFLASIFAKSAGEIAGPDLVVRVSDAQNRSIGHSRRHRMVGHSAAVNLIVDTVAKDVTEQQGASTKPPTRGEDLLAAIDWTRRYLTERLQMPDVFQSTSVLSTTSYLDFDRPGHPALPSPYDSVFLRKTVVAPPPAFELKPGRHEIRGVGQPAVAYISHIAAACGVSVADAQRLIDDGAATLSLASLSRIYFGSRAARVAGLSTWEFVELRKLCLQSLVPEGLGTPDSGAVEAAAALGAVGVPVAGAVHCLTHRSEHDESDEERKGTVTLLTELRTALAKIAGDNTIAPGASDVDGRLVRAQLQRLTWDAGIVAEAMEALSHDGTALDTTAIDVLSRHLYTFAVVDHSTVLDPRIAGGLLIPPALGSRCFYDALTRRLHFLGSMSAADHVALLALSADATYTAALATLRDVRAAPMPAADVFIDTAALTSLAAMTAAAERFALVLPKVVAWRQRSTSSVEVATKLSSAFGIEASTARRLVETWLTSGRVTRDPTAGALEDFLDPAFVYSPPELDVSEERFPDVFHSCARIGKTAQLAQRLGLSERTWSWLFRPAARQQQWLDPNTLPARAGEPAASLAGLLRLVNLTRLQQRIPGGERTLAVIYEMCAASDGSDDAIVNRLGELTGWNASDLEKLLGVTGFALAGSPHLRPALAGEWLLLRLTECFETMRRLGISAAQCLSWANRDIGASESAEIQNAVRGRHTDAGWLSAAKPLRNALRERQREALVAYLIAQQGLRDSNELYNRYLIDVKMGAAAITSRIKQACASTQLFVQRCLLNLEPDVAPSAIDTHLWRWMRSYRVWEANRQIYLFPENWLEPELRDDATPDFRTFASALLQGDVDSDRAETELRRHIAAVAELADLDHQALCLTSGAPSDVTKPLAHVFARTRRTPHRHFYRTQNQATRTWTAWQRIQPDIDSDFVLPAAYEDRVLLYWPSFVSKAEDTVEPGSTTPKKFTEVSMSNSALVGLEWSPKSVSRRALATVSGADELSAERFIFDGNLFFHPTTGQKWFQARVKTSTATYNANGTSRIEGFLSFEIEHGDEEVAQDGRTVTTDNRDTDLGLIRKYGAWYSIQQDEPLVLHFDRLQTLLGKTPGFFKLLADWQQPAVLARSPFLYQDATGSFLIFPTPGHSAPLTLTLDPASHVAMPAIAGVLRSQGLDAFYSVTNQSRGSWADRLKTYSPTSAANIDDQKGVVDFGSTGSYSVYNWEMFFHSAIYVAVSLSRNRRFEEAKRWFEHVFDPTSTSSDPSPNRFWRFLPFHDAGKPPAIGELLERLAAGDPDLTAAVIDWRANPFEPHRVARLRPSAYQWSVVMKYLDNLIAWADELFRGDTIESINEATQLYVLAAEILGPRPRHIGKDRKPNTQSFSQLNGRLDAFSNVLVQLESVVAADAVGASAAATAGGLPVLYGEYFCVPPNEMMLSYWDTVADRLFKIRHSMNLQGVVRQLPLYEPPLDPGLLVKAAAAGVDLATVLRDQSAPLPAYRFGVMLQKALELCGEVRALGSALLSALEKRDAEQMSLLRAGQETGLLRMIEEVKQGQLLEAQAQLAALQQSREAAVTKFIHYEKLLGVATPTTPKPGEAIALAQEPVGAQVQDSAGTKLIAAEVEEAKSLKASNELQLAAGLAEMLANYLRLIPEFTAGFAGSGSTFGGANLGQAASMYGGVFRTLAAQSAYEATRVGKQAVFLLRENEWVVQRNLAAQDIMHIDKEAATSELRIEIANKELTNHRRQIANSQAVEETLRTKFTSQDLYAFMVGQVSAVHFQAYQLAYDLARRAEQTFRHELALEGADGSFIQFGYWNSLKKGLLAGEQLALDLRRMEVAFHDLNRREFEITKHVSLRRLDPEQLVMLRTTGSCEFDVPEWLFDLDAPGQYLRRLKSVSLSIPCVVGPYTGVFCKLTLLKSQVRRSAASLADYLGALESVLTSSASGDGGLFESNLRDERYLPFEGSGAISTWSLQLPEPVLAQFDYATISDVIFHLRYTARDGGSELRSVAVANVTTKLKAAGAGALLIDVKREFSNEWARAAASPATASLAVTLTNEMLPYVFASTRYRQSVSLFDFSLDESTGDPRGFRALEGDSGHTAFTAPIALGTVNTLLAACGGGEPMLLVELGGK